MDIEARLRSLEAQVLALTHLVNTLASANSVKVETPVQQFPMYPTVNIPNIGTAI